MAKTPAPQYRSESLSEYLTSGVSLRAVVLGLALVVLINLWIPYSEYIVRASRMNLSHFPVAVFILFLLIRYLLTPLLSTLNPAFSLTPSEQLVIIAMGLAGGVVPGSGVLGFLLGTIATPYYFATPENRWAEFFHAHLPTYLVPPNTGGAMRDFYEGTLPGTPIPWPIWVAPLFWWLVFIVAIVFVSACIAVILRRQWSENERLTFPLLSPALHIVSPESTRDKSLQYRGLYWAGFALSSGILSYNILHFFFPLVPDIKLTLPFFYFAKGYPPIFPRFNIYIMGFAYFANLDVLFSMWFFHLLFYQIPGGLLIASDLICPAAAIPMAHSTFPARAGCVLARCVFSFSGDCTSLATTSKPSSSKLSIRNTHRRQRGTHVLSQRYFGPVFRHAFYYHLVIPIRHGLFSHRLLHCGYLCHLHRRSACRRSNRHPLCAGPDQRTGFHHLFSRRTRPFNAHNDIARPLLRAHQLYSRSVYARVDPHCQIV